MAKLPVEKLDTSRAHGSVHGEPTHKIAFTQRSLGIEAWPYDAEGNLIEAALNGPQREKLKERRAAAEKAPEAKLTDKAIKAEEEELAGLTEGEGPKSQDDETDEINLVQWLKGDVRYRPHEIQGVVKKRYGANKPRLAEAAMYLVEEKKLVPRNEVSDTLLPKVG